MASKRGKWASVLLYARRRTNIAAELDQNDSTYI